jgi:hypothetical protein
MIIYTNLIQILMSNYQLADTQKGYRITLNLSVDDDFKPENINWSKVLQLNDYESADVYIENTN